MQRRRMHQSDAFWHSWSIFPRSSTRRPSPGASTSGLPSLEPQQAGHLLWNLSQKNDLTRGLRSLLTTPRPPWSFNQKSDLARGTPLRNIPHQHSQQAARRAPMRAQKNRAARLGGGRAIKRPQACCKTVARKISRPGSNGIVVPLGTVVHTEEVSGRSLAKGPSPKLAHHIVMSGKRKLVGCATNRHAAVTSPAPRSEARGG